jgi:hypothetical protein
MLNRRVAIEAGEAFRVVEVFRCFGRHCVYIARSSSGADVCLLHDWVSLAPSVP